MKQVLSLFTFGIGALSSSRFFATLKPHCRHCGFGTEQARPVQHEARRLARLPLADICHSMTS